jgi:hypothetical protein
VESEKDKQENAQPQAEAPKAAEAPAAEAPAKAATGSKLALDLGAGVSYADRISASGSLAPFAALLNSRVGALANVGYRLTPALSLGAEAGIDFITLNSSGISLTLYDLQIRANVRYMFGTIGVEAFGGAFVNGVAANGAGLVNYMDLDAGARLRLGGFYAEASYVFGVQSTSVNVASLGGMAASYPRFGLGYAFRLIK